ncbi:acyl-CoA carboxylase subunit epsilon [Mycobacterium pseudokansasii]|uniref:acyl-CoA carboxylase subunit epsilon n=1 Tax=Mycobacterium pseudokansasii TaxID=2341080 RepID=UPI0007B53A97|nr:acyl-CoA carboxylase subunit epsilon [Mycobacterium pseudokansasii]KZS67330.1 hypothetical protein A4G27_19870 [Mycobacterium kansasii]
MSRVSVASDGNETNNHAPVSRVSGASVASDGNETNNHAPVSRVSGASAMNAMNERNQTSETRTADPAPHPHEPHIEIVKGHPTDQELAALISVLGSVSGAPPAPETEPTRWGLPVDKLRFPVFSWQRITLQEMLHMRR